MDFDFGSVAEGVDLSAITDPVALFDALPNKSPGLGYLRQVQATVLERWSLRRAEPDLVIKMNTGTGKTIVGLLALEVSLNEGHGPALYLTPDPHLAERVRGEGRRLGISVVEDPANPRFGSCESICVTTLQTLFNGKSRFGVAGSRAAVPIGTVVIDDAHSAVTRLEELSRITVPTGHPAHGRLLDLFEADLRAQSASALMDLRAGEHGAVMRIPFWAWWDRQAEVLGILHPLRSTPLLEWTWPLISDQLGLCQATLTHQGIEIDPSLPPVQKFPSFTDARRRIYMTATLANDSPLVTHFAADAASISQPIAPDSAADLGDRLVLAPQALVPDLTDAQLREAIATIAVTNNVVVLVPSKAKALEWADVANITASSASEIGEAVDALTSGAVGLVVIINRYDGIDLPEDACRVLVIDGLPQATGGAQRREATGLRGSATIITRQVQRFEQGLGRAVRSREDRCAVLVLDRRLVDLISRADVLPRLSPGTRAQMALSRQVARTLERTRHLTMEDLTDLIQKVVDGAEDFKAAARKALLDVRYETVPLDPTAVPLRNAYDAAVRGDHETAAREAGSAANAARSAMKDDRLAGWLMETAAAYRHPIDPVTAQRMLMSASGSNASVLRPIAGLAFTPSRPARVQAEAAVEYLTDHYATASEFRLHTEAIVADLAWDPEHTEEAEQAWAELAGHLGFTSQRPEKEIGVGCDVVWTSSDQLHLVIEVKSGADTESIGKRDIDQLGGSVRWAENVFGRSATVAPVMVHPSSAADRRGTPPPGTRVVDREHLDELISAIRSYTTALCVDDKYRDVDAVRDQLLHAGFNGSQFLTRFGANVRTARIP